MRRWMKLFETLSGPVLIEDSADHGSVEGYVVDSHSAQVMNWFQYRHDVYEPTIIEMVQGYERVAFLNNINVDEEHRGQGHGEDMLQWFESSAADNGAEVVFLFADINEEQTQGFELVKWYIKNGYEEVHPPEGLLYCPLMMKSLW